ncbi:MAG TPA: hemerythrin domain-containing protein, partial [Saprospiraceae bacterium]|nr:hemerythrin domain-containing protein [Saprospiraceae bacterium]
FFMDALEVLMEEHEIILLAIGILNKSVSKLKNGGQVSSGFYDSFLDIVKNFADRCHHAKEETIYFPMMRQRDPGQDDVVSVLLDEHEKGRGFLGALGVAVGKNSSRDIVENSEGYGQLLALHIRKENLLFPDWMKMLSDGDKADLFERFEEIEERVIGKGKHEEYAQRIEGLRSKL